MSKGVFNEWDKKCAEIKDLKEENAQLRNGFDDEMRYSAKLMDMTNELNAFLNHIAQHAKCPRVIREARRAIELIKKTV